ncbi:MAG TPA: hypothetical protein VF721_16665 [Pyrinomonadaceae bacterium]|jgi:hypothetical protein
MVKIAVSAATFRFTNLCFSPDGFYQFINIQIFLLPEKRLREALSERLARGGDYWKAGVIKCLKFMKKSEVFIDFRL